MHFGGYILDIFNIVIFVITTDYCLEKKFNTNRLRIISIILFLSLFSVMNRFFITNTYISVFILHFIYISILIFMQKETRLLGSIILSILYVACQLNKILIDNLLLLFDVDLILSNNIIIFETILFDIMIFLMKNKFLQVTANIKNKEYDNFTYVVSILVDFILCLNIHQQRQISRLSTNILIGGLFVFSIVMIFHFLKIQFNSYRISVLNTELQRKNDELRKIKHDYGSQISCIYGLYLMKRYDDIGDALKRIIEDKDKLINIETNVNKYSMIFATSLRDAEKEKGINVIVEDTIDYKKVKVPYIYIHRVISNIVSNAVRAMGGKGIIRASAYNLSDKNIIEIENNGPKIPDDVLEKIFKKGFTTKKAKSTEHGYGLNIVKDLLRAYGGKIKVDSNEKRTIFKIIF
ncbi:sensor histidine kinase [Clostridium sp. BJN0001]|uniref:sensor histidine kinase n=1 Tax=Clostridium sp. BJN0001 TaxID=2930219 RepID=UPI001FD23AE1|nr:sensor histidine kinase [Clostridium sp. BJN0001]